MNDRVPVNPGRVLITPENGNAAFYATMTRADNPTQEGTPLNKNTLLKDATAALFGLGADAVPDDVLGAMALLSGAGEPNTAIVGAIGQCYYDTDAEQFYKCVAHITSGSTIVYIWAAISGGGGNEAAFGTRGPIIVESTTTLDLTAYGLKVGDKVNVVCIGGGGGGGGGASFAGGAGGKAGVKGTYNGGFGGGGGGGYGGGGGGGGAQAGAGYGGGGGGGGYLKAGTVTLVSTSVAVTIGAAGTAGASGKSGGTGGTTSFGSHLSASGGGGGGAGGGGASSSTGVTGVGGHAGGNGASATATNQSAGGGGGGGGWIVESVTTNSGTAGTNGVSGSTSSNANGGDGGTGGGTGGNYANPAHDGGDGKGVCLIWY